MNAKLREDVIEGERKSEERKGYPRGKKKERIPPNPRSRIPYSHVTTRSPYPFVAEEIAKPRTGRHDLLSKWRAAGRQAATNPTHCSVPLMICSSCQNNNASLLFSSCSICTIRAKRAVAAAIVIKPTSITTAMPHFWRRVVCSF